METRLIGARMPRVEDVRLLTGRGRYVDDIVLPGLLEVAFVRSAEAHARIKGVDATAAATMPGVEAVFTQADFGPDFVHKRQPQPGPHPALKHGVTPAPLAIDEVRYVGEPIAMVLAETRHQAEDAATLVALEFETLPVVVGLASAAGNGARAHDGAETNVAAGLRWAFGDVEAAFAAAPQRLTERFAQHRGGGHSLEGRGVIASYDAITGQLVIITSTQVPHLVRRNLALYLGLDESRIRVVAPDVGGGFGPKCIVYSEEYALALAAMKLGRPVKWIEDRREHFLATAQQRDSIWEVEAAFSDEGKIAAIRGKVVLDVGAYVPYGLTVALTSLAPFPGPYAIGAVDLSLDCLYTNAVPVAPVRGAGRPHAAFVLERLADRVAQHLGLTPEEIRRRNFIGKDAFPYATGAKLPNGVAVTYDSGDYQAALDEALRLSDHLEFARRQIEARAQGCYIGRGIAAFNEDTGIAPFEGVTVRVMPSGKVQVITGAAGQGQGLPTILSQIVAEALGVTVDAIEVQSADTGLFPYGIGAVGSRTAVTAGSSAELAAREVRAKALKIAAQEFEAAESDLEIVDGAVRIMGVPGKTVPLAAIATQLAGAITAPLPEGCAPGLEATSYHQVTRPAYAGGVTVAEVAVDVDTGHVKLDGYWVVHDCGTLINPMIVDGQVIGGAVHGIGNALFERIVYAENGQPQTTTLSEYLLPTASEIPRIVVSHRETPSPLNPLGVKGAGEGGTIPAAAAVIAAIEDALAPLGVRLSTYPLDPPVIAALIQQRLSIES